MITVTSRVLRSSRLLRPFFHQHRPSLTLDRVISVHFKFFSNNADSPPDEVSIAAQPTASSEAIEESLEATVARHEAQLAEFAQFTKFMKVYVSRDLSRRANIVIGEGLLQCLAPQPQKQLRPSSILSPPTRSKHDHEKVLEAIAFLTSMDVVKEAENLLHLSALFPSEGGASHILPAKQVLGLKKLISILTNKQ